MNNFKYSPKEKFNNFKSYYLICLKNAYTIDYLYIILASIGFSIFLHFVGRSKNTYIAVIAFAVIPLIPLLIAPISIYLKCRTNWSRIVELSDQSLTVKTGNGSELYNLLNLQRVVIDYSHTGIRFDIGGEKIFSQKNIYIEAQNKEELALIMKTVLAVKPDVNIVTVRWLSIHNYDVNQLFH